MQRISPILIEMLGYPTANLNHSMWADLHVINGFEHASISLDGAVLWDGVVAADRVARLDELDCMDIGLVIERRALA